MRPLPGRDIAPTRDGLIASDVTGARHSRWHHGVAAALWCGACLWAIATFSVSNDHFGRLVPARQIARFGEWPFRDFFDPGYFLTEFSSAGVQWLFGDNLLGEMLLTSMFIATGTVIVFWIAREVSQSLGVAFAVATVALFAVPRPYDYDKVLFYPAGLLLACRYAERPTRQRALGLAAIAVAGAGFRYDTGVYIAIAAIVALAARYGVQWTPLAKAGVRLLTVVSCVALPMLAALHWQVGLWNAADQAWTYGTRERARTQISSWPTLSVGPAVGWAPVPAPPRINVRWAPGVDEPTIERIAARLHLTDGRAPSAPDSRTWSYAILDPNPEALRQVVNDPAIEDTAGIERGALVLSEPESWWARTTRALPPLRLRLLPQFWAQPANAPALLFNLCWALPFVTLVLLLIRRHDDRPVSTWLWSVTALCVVTNALVLRDPVEARIGGVAAAPAILAGWLTVQLWRAARTRARLQSRLRAALSLALVAAMLVCAVGTIVWSLSMAGDWRRRVWPQLRSFEPLTGNLTIGLASPPPESQLPTGGLAGLVRYVRECTGPDDRVFASWFVPELYFFAQRGFAGGMTVVFGGHWSEPRFQQRSIDWLRTQRPPLAIIEQRSRSAFVEAYPQLASFLAARYRVAGSSDFGNPDAPGGYQVLAEASLPPTRLDPVTHLPCFR